MPRLELAFLWHMHQPPYRDPTTGSYILPWVRLHSTRAYLDMADIHERYPGVRSTVNFVPILLEQLEDYVAGRARDRFLELTIRPAADLLESERAFLLRNFFMVSWDQGVMPIPRYAELLQKRGFDLSHVDLDKVARSFSVAEIRDLQVLFNLTWMGFAARSRYEVVRHLLAKGRDFTEEEKLALVDTQRAIMSSIIPLWRKLQREGQVELSTTPYYHPILPLVCDTDAARVALPNNPLPPRLRARDDAITHVIRAREYFDERFGQMPMGMWPAEGSVSPEALEVLASQGVTWTASDEDVLLHSLPPGADRREVLYRPWNVKAGDRQIAMVFRDHGLSDLIGFTYARSGPREAVDDFLGHLSRIADHAPRVGGQPPLCSVILDGENPWEHYPESGFAFLSELYSRLQAEEQGITSTTIGARVAKGVPGGRIDRIWSGSWVEANYRIWIGHHEDVTAWALVGEAHRALKEAEAAGADAEVLAAAREHLLAAEASDWFWWYGEDFTTESAAEFDSLFRGHIQQVFRILDRNLPSRAMSPIAAGVRPAGHATPARQPTGFITPRLDGLAQSWRDWLGAGLFRAEHARGGSMHQSVGVFSQVVFGFDPDHLYLRLDPAGEGPLEESIDGLRIRLQKQGRTLELRGTFSHGDISLLDQEKGERAGHGKVRAIVELAIPLSLVGLSAGDRIEVSISGTRGEVEADRIPSHGWLLLEVPGVDFERILWKV